MRAARGEQRRSGHDGGASKGGASPKASPAAAGGLWSSLALQVAPATDPLELEADRVADRVLAGEGVTVAAGGSPLVHRTCAACAAEDDELHVQRKCAACAREDEQLPVHRRANGASHGGRGAAGLVASTLNHTGAPLDAAARGFFEPRFGRDLSDVRIHTGAHADRSARAINALAYTSGAHIAFADGQFAPDTMAGRRLLAHELAHVAQQDGASPRVLRAAAVLNPPASLYLEAEVHGSVLAFEIDTTGVAAADALADDVELLQAVADVVESILVQAANAGETVEFLSGPRVAAAIRTDLVAVVTRFVVTMPTLKALIEERAAAVQRTGIRSEVEAWLAVHWRIAPDSIQWSAAIPRLQVPAAPIGETAIQRSSRERYRLLLRLLAADEEAEGDRAGGIVDMTALDAGLREYADTVLPASPLAEWLVESHGEAFLSSWIPQLRAIQFIPAGFSIDALRPVFDEWTLEKRRNDIIDNFMEFEAPQLAVMFLYDSWALSPFSPQEFLEKLDLTAYESALEDSFVRAIEARAKRDPQYREVFRVLSVERTRFALISKIYSMALVQQRTRDNALLHFGSVPVDSLTSTEAAIAGNPAGYAQAARSAAAVTFGVLDHVKGGADPDEAVTVWAAAQLRAAGVPAFGEFVGLVVLLGYIDQLGKLIESERSEAEATIRARVKVDYPTLQRLIKEQADFAERFIRDKWLPMLKEVALDMLLANRLELEAKKTELEKPNPQRVIELFAGADQLREVADGLESGEVESVEIGQLSISAKNVKFLYQTADAMDAEAKLLADPDRRKERIAELNRVLDLFKEVSDDIRSDDYDPLDYAASVYEEARARLGIGEYEPGTTVYMALTGQAAATNPFLARTLVWWRYEGEQRRFWKQVLMMVGALALSIAAMLTGGIVGLILKAADMIVDLAMGAMDLSEANKMVRMAEVDIHGDIRGISVEDAKSVRRRALFGFGLSIGLNALGVGLSPTGRRVAGSVWAWRAALSPAARRALRANRELAELFATMDPVVRRLLTACDSPCTIPLTATKPQVDKLTKLIKKLGITGEHPGLREFLHHPERIKNLDKAIQTLDGVEDLAELERRLDRAIVSKAPTGVTPFRNKDGRWVYPRADKVQVVEYDLAAYGTHKDMGTENFFQSHHGIQNEWAERRFGSLYDQDAGRCILLRDRHRRTPHRIVSARQAERKANVPWANRTYEMERKSMMEDLAEAGVPPPIRDQLLKESDQYFGTIFRAVEKRAQAKGLKGAALDTHLTDLFGGWRPGSP